MDSPGRTSALTEIAPRLQRVPVAEPQRALDEGGQRHDDDGGRDRHGGDDETGVGRPAGHVGRWWRDGEPEAAAPSPLQPRRHDHAGQRRGELHDRQRRRRADVAEPGRLTPDLDLDRRPPDAAEESRTTPNDVNVNTKTMPPPPQRRDDRRQRDLPEHASRRRSERRRRVLAVTGQRGEDGADGAHDDRQVEHDVGGDDGDDAAVDRVGAGQRAWRHPSTTVGSTNTAASVPSRSRRPGKS